MSGGGSPYGSSNNFFPQQRTGGPDFSPMPPPPTYTGQPFTGGNMNVPPQMPPQMPPPQMQPPMQPQMQQQPMQPPQQPQRPVDPAVQAYMNQNYFPGIHGGPDPSMLSMPSQDPQPQPKGLVMSEGGQTNALARPLTGPPGTTNGPGGLGFATPGQPTQLFGPTAGLFGGAQRPPETPNNFGYYPGTQQWGAPNMGWASQWGKQPGT